MKLHTLQIIWSAALAVFISGCNSGVKTETFDFNRLLGRWVFSESESAQFEEWRASGTDHFGGRGFVLELGDTTFIETLEIKMTNGLWTYSAKVSDGPTAEVIPFTLSKQSERGVEFINTGQDFPRKIGYEFLSAEEMQVYLEGPRDGQNIRVMFDYKRSE